ncbi:MAG TPA: GNAT family N-acetyltransferase [Acidimicrobiales bacterium]|nr:GNAT family N-acetyltransferase [Acidimicrobiales bacterium]
MSEVTEVDEEMVAAVARLLPELSRSAPPLGADELSEIAASPATRLLVARDPESGEVLGTLTLVLFRNLSGLRAWIEDVVVHPEARGHGVGEALSRQALSIAAEAGARTVDLTSRPSREAANRLYQRMGFERRDTNVYRYSLDG